MSQLEHVVVLTNGIRMHAAVQGEGPAVLFCHGFPGLWYSWRRQLPAIAAAGFRAIAVDMRGYGRTDRPLRARDVLDVSFTIKDIYEKSGRSGDLVFVEREYEFIDVNARERIGGGKWVSLRRFNK